MDNRLLSRKVVVITGASRGLGRELAIQMAKMGASVVVNYHKDDVSAKDTLDNLSECNTNCMIYRADVSAEIQVKNMYRDVISHYGKVDILINNAGKNDDDYLHFISEERWNSVIKTNLNGTFLCSKYFSKNMIHNKQGKILNIASLKGQLGAEGQSNYSASKAAIIGLTKSMAKEMGKMNISVNAICPGYIMTDLNKENNNKCRIATNMSALEIDYCMEDFLNFVTFLCSDYIKGISGQVFNLDSRIF